jgi:SecD/SecF fusion protein
MRVYHCMRYKWWFLGSLTAVTIFAVMAIFVVGLDFGIDFKGGVRIEFTLQTEASVDDIRGLVSDAGVTEPVVQSVGTVEAGTTFLVTADEMSDAQVEAIAATLAADYGLDQAATGVERVGASFGEDTTRLAFIAVGIAILFIVAYLWWRFGIKFAIPAILALLHDVGLALGIYAVSGRLVTAATVAAILTILGYSVHDTIIVFDRIRENTQLMKKETYGDMVDLSIRQTMGRSINTTIAILLPLLSILFFGGPTLRDFAIALTIGVIAGTYSSFFVAAPLLTIWKEREPQYKKRLTTPGTVTAGVTSTTSATVTGVTPSTQASPKNGGATKPAQKGNTSKSAKTTSSKGRSKKR